MTSKDDFVFDLSMHRYRCIVRGIVDGRCGKPLIHRRSTRSSRSGSVPLDGLKSLFASGDRYTENQMVKGASNLKQGRSSVFKKGASVPLHGLRYLFSESRNAQVRKVGHRKPFEGHEPRDLRLNVLFCSETNSSAIKLRSNGGKTLRERRVPEIHLGSTFVYKHKEGAAAGTVKTFKNAVRPTKVHLKPYSLKRFNRWVDEILLQGYHPIRGFKEHYGEKWRVVIVGKMKKMNRLQLKEWWADPERPWVQKNTQIATSGSVVKRAFKCRTKPPWHCLDCENCVLSEHQLKFCRRCYDKAISKAGYVRSSEGLWGLPPDKVSHFKMMVSVPRSSTSSCFFKECFGRMTRYVPIKDDPRLKMINGVVVRLK